jgi:hypothetical protein
VCGGGEKVRIKVSSDQELLSLVPKPFEGEEKVPGGEAKSYYTSLFYFLSGRINTY